MGKELVSVNDVIEHVVGSSIQLALGEGFRFRHTGTDTSTFDGILELNGVPVAVVEITRVLNQVDQNFLAALEDIEIGNGLPLTTGSGRWAAGIGTTTRIKDQTSEQFQEIINLLKKEGLRKYAPGWYPQRKSMNLLCHELGVRDIHLIDHAEDAVYRYPAMETTGNVLNLSSELIVAEIQQILDSPAIQSKASKFVERSNGLPPYLVLVIGEGFSTSVQFALRDFRSTLEIPITPLLLPEGIAILWLTGPQAWTVSFSTDRGWLLHDTRNIEIQLVLDEQKL